MVQQRLPRQGKSMGGRPAKSASEFIVLACPLGNCASASAQLDCSNGERA
jgi:hypothetical protein